MATWRALRRRIMTPGPSAVKVGSRGFHRKNAAVEELLETVGTRLLEGYGHAMEARSPSEAEERLDAVPERFRGFAYEGAAMAFTILDGLSLGRTSRISEFLAGKGAEHVYTAHVGIGWGLARLPKVRWSKIAVPDPLLRWLVLDGYGFHQAFFQTQRYVHEQFRDPDFPWPGARDRVAGDRVANRGGTSWYAGHALDQGIGRAMWFVGGADPDVVADMLNRFPEPRRPDLYSGAGLAATYAGGADERELASFWRRAGTYRAQVAQGCVFAAEARARGGILAPHTAVATEAFCGLTPEQAAKISLRELPESPDPHEQAGGPDLPAYEVWRRRIADEFLCVGRC